MLCSYEGLNFKRSSGGVQRGVTRCRIVKNSYCVEKPEDKIAIHSQMYEYLTCLEELCVVIYTETDSLRKSVSQSHCISCLGELSFSKGGAPSMG